ncbi:hypothetical protein MNBD_ALPHA09-453 [hydrothermal vent metagenome]|uniref:Uncharacterized protein n=1 Tax=hydrothermal vent metagenome TaxID=652676 RepID=A0A3B0T5R4_9ZZZZ
MTRKDLPRAQFEHRYPLHVAYVAGLRALAGSVAFVALWLLAGGTVVAVISAAGITIFVAYGVIAVGRAREILVVSPTGIVVRGWRRREILFAELTALRLAYYSTRRDGEKGWMELVVRAGGARLVVESEIDGFSRIASACFDHATKIGLTLSPASERNFAVALDDSVSMGQKTGFGTTRTAR